MKKLLLIITILLILLTTFLTTFVSAEYCGIQNVCANDYSTKAVAYNSSLEFNLGRITSFGSANEKLPAALYYLNRNSSGDDVKAQSLIDKLESLPTTQQKIYALWINKKFDKNIDVSFSDELEGLLGDVDSDNVSRINTLLSDKAVQGWEAETNAEDLENLILSLLMIYDLSDDPGNSLNNDLLHVRAEMTLDYLFAIQAATTITGEYNLPGLSGFNNKLAYFQETPITNWNKLLLPIDENIDAIEPGIIVAGYCAPSQVRTIYNYRKENNKELKTQIQNSGINLITKDIDKDYTISSLQYDYSDNNPGEESTLGLSIKSKTDSLSYFNVWARTGATGDNKQFFFYFDKDPQQVIIGSLEVDSCQEPNIYLSPSGTSAYVLNSEDGQGAALIKIGDKYFALRADKKLYLTDINKRYKPLTQFIPSIIKSINSATKEDWGKIIFVNDSSNMTFGMELLSPEYVQTLFDAAPLEDCDEFNDLSLQQQLCLEAVKRSNLLSNYLSNTSITLTNDGPEYHSSISGNEKTYKMISNAGTIEIQDDESNLYSLNDVAPREIKYLATIPTNYLSYGADGSKIIYLLNTNGEDFLKLNFEANNADDAKCMLVPQNLGDGGTSDESGVTLTLNDDSDKMAFIAANFINKFGDSKYSINCGPLNSIAGTSFANNGCLINSSSGKSLAITYSGQISSVFDSFKNYFPYKIWGSEGLTDSTLTLNIASNCQNPASGDITPFKFLSCGSLFDVQGQKIYLWLNPNDGIILLSEDQDPFTTGFADTFLDFLSGIFSSEDLVFDQEMMKPFDSAIINSLPGKSLQIIERNGNLLLLADNLAYNFEPLKEVYGGTYKKGDNKQMIENLPKNQLLLKKLKKIRLSELGDGSNYESNHEDQILDLDEECLPGQEELCANGLKKTCDEGLWDTSNCDDCIDADGDGYFAEGCPDQDKYDWKDADPSQRISLNGVACDENYNPLQYVSQEGLQTYLSDFCGSKFSDVINSESHPENYKYAGCPQCSYPGATEFCDKVPNGNQYTEVRDPSCNYQTEEQTDYSCEDQEGDCSYICNYVPPEPPDETNDCENTCDNSYCLDGDCVECLSDDDCGDYEECELNSHSCVPLIDDVCNLPGYKCDLINRNHEQLYFNQP